MAVVRTCFGTRIALPLSSYRQAFRAFTYQETSTVSINRKATHLTYQQSRTLSMANMETYATLHHKLEAGGAVNAWSSMPCAVTAELLAGCGFDSLTVDLQHGLIDYPMAVSMLQAISRTNVTPLVRVPWNEPGIIGKVLDAGALGIICPMINNREQCEAFVKACLYPPAGARSTGPTRANMVYGVEYWGKANEYVLPMAMVETKEALANVKEIATTPGLRAIYIGPSDLSVSMGYKPGCDRTEPEVLEAISVIRQACKDAGIYVALHCDNPTYAHQALKKDGIDLVSLSTDVRLLAKIAASELAIIRQ
eukprot:m.62566 g.62566  ORF g.62566 m.62566 type:complete len:309 (-) comp11518_c0_seq2:97-1023(-)